MKFQDARLEQMAGFKEQYPKKILPEIVLWGRSNVGKSTFINSFLNRKNLAYTSSAPGKTRTVNFYNVDETFRLVDLPGYGYAKASKKEQEKWLQGIAEYFENRDMIAELILLTDLRHDPTALDLEAYQFLLDAGFSGIVIGTKLDKIAKTKRRERIENMAEKLGMDLDLLYAYSALERESLSEIHDLFAQILDYAKK